LVDVTLWLSHDRFCQGKHCPHNSADISAEFQLGAGVTPEMVAERDRIQRSALSLTRNAIGGEISGVVAV
jgi:hypothetical protein